jgi:hypothetical protein
VSLTIRPLDRAAPPADLTPNDEQRGIFIYWRPGADAPWQCQPIAFRAVSPAGDGTPPKDADELRRYILAAYAIAATHHPIPSDAEIVYEVRS